MKLILLAAAIGLLSALFGTPALIRFLRRHGYAQAIRATTEEVLYPEHDAKRGTPSMGGLVIVGAVHLAYFGAHLIMWLPPRVSGLLLLFLITGLGLVGFLDDYIKIFQQRSTGLRARTKLIGQALVALTFAFLALRFPDEGGRTPASLSVSFVRDLPGLPFLDPVRGLPFLQTRWMLLITVLTVIWIYFLITATSNAVNLTDGLDGLAAGACVATFTAYVLIGVFQFQQACGLVVTPQCYNVRDPLDLAIVAAALLGACAGFLWWNAAPAAIFMGDTGSLALGGAVAGLAIMTRTELLLLLLGGLFVLITMSVILQVLWFKATGKRIFKMAPLQHHFELLGWHEVTIVIRFWIIAALLVGAGLGLFYAEWVTGAQL